MRACMGLVLLSAALFTTVLPAQGREREMMHRGDLPRVAIRHQLFARQHFFVRRRVEPPSGYPLDYYGADTTDEPTVTEVSPVIVVAPPAPTPALETREAHATVETTPQGVTVIRGPGSHHLVP